MKPLYLIACLGVLGLVAFASGCTTLTSLQNDLGGLIPKQATSYNLYNLTIPTGVTTVDSGNCQTELLSRYSNITILDCTVKNVNTVTKKYECTCTAK